MRPLHCKGDRIVLAARGVLFGNMSIQAFDVYCIMVVLLFSVAFLLSRVSSLFVTVERRRNGMFSLHRTRNAQFCQAIHFVEGACSGPSCFCGEIWHTRYKQIELLGFEHPNLPWRARLDVS